MSKPKVKAKKPKKKVKSKDIPAVQQDLEGNCIREIFETRIYDVLDAGQTGLRIRYTERTAAAAEEHYQKLVKNKGAPKANNYRYEWILNRMKARDFKQDDQVLLRSWHALTRTFWDFEAKKIPNGFIKHRIEEIEYIELRTDKFFIRLRSKTWDKKLEKWAQQLHPLKPKDASKRADKARAARGKIEAYIQARIRIFKNEVATPREQEAYYKVLTDHVFKRVGEKHRAKGGNQGTLEV